MNTDLFPVRIGLLAVAFESAGRRIRIKVERNAFASQLVGHYLYQKVLFKLRDVLKLDTDRIIGKAVNSFAIKGQPVPVWKLDLHPEQISLPDCVVPLNKTPADTDLIDQRRQFFAILGKPVDRQVYSKSVVSSLIDRHIAGSVE